MIAHFVRTTHHDTGAVELYCGQKRERRVEARPDAPACAECVRGALGAVQDNMLHNLDESAKGDRSWLGHYDEATLRIERLERRLAKIERKGKRR